MKPLLIAHRGDTNNFSENTFEAFRSAFDLGADGVECDVQESQSGRIIIVHNYEYDRSIQYPLLTDFLKEFSSKGKLEIEIKTISSKVVSKVAKIINEYNPPDYEITSSVLPLLPIVRKCLPNAQIGMIFKDVLLEEWMTEEFIPNFLLDYMNITKANVLHLSLKKYTENIVNLLHSKNFKLHTHLTDDSLEKYKKILQLNLDQCTFDNMDLLNNR